MRFLWQGPGWSLRLLRFISKAFGLCSVRVSDSDDISVFNVRWKERIYSYLCIWVYNYLSSWFLSFLRALFLFISLSICFPFSLSLFPCWVGVLLSLNTSHFCKLQVQELQRLVSIPGRTVRRAALTVTSVKPVHPLRGSARLMHSFLSCRSLQAKAEGPRRRDHSETQKPMYLYIFEVKSDSSVRERIFPHKEWNWDWRRLRLYSNIMKVLLLVGFRLISSDHSFAG